MNRFVMGCFASAALLGVSLLDPLSIYGQGQGTGAGQGGAGQGGAGQGQPGAGQGGAGQAQPGAKGALPAQPKGQTGQPTVPAQPLNPKAKQGQDDNDNVRRPPDDGKFHPLDKQKDGGTTQPGQQNQQNQQGNDQKKQTDRGATPAQPGGPGQPATPATPMNPKAKQNTQDTPSRTGETPSRDKDGQNGNGKQKFRVGEPSNNTGGNNNNNNTGGNNNTDQTKLNTDSLLGGLVNLNIGDINIQANDLVNINNALNNNQVQALLQALNNNPQARQNAELLTQRLRERGILEEGLRIIGFADGKLYTMMGGAPSR